MDSRRGDGGALRGNPRVALFRAQGLHGIDGCGAAGGDETGHCSYDEQHRGCNGERSGDASAKGGKEVAKQNGGKDGK